MPKKRLPAKADRTVWEKVAKGRPGITWDGVVEKEWNDVGGNLQEILPIEKFAGYKEEVKKHVEIRENPALRNNVNGEEHLEILRG